MVELTGDYWDIVEAALTSLPESSALREPALASFDHLKKRVLTNHRKDALAPDMARLLIDMGDALRLEIAYRKRTKQTYSAGFEELLARLDRLGNTA